MNAQKISCLSGSIRSVAVLFLLLNVSLVSRVFAQSTDTFPAGTLPSRTPSAPFLVAPSFALAGTPSSVVMGDLNHDGKPDLVTSDPVAGKVTVFLGTGDGRFATGVEFVTGSHPSAVAIADLNGDGHPVVLVGDESKGTIGVYSSNGNGTLQLKQSLSAGLAPAYLTIGDFNGDGKPDLAVASRLTASMAILLNDGTGGLQTSAVTPLRKTSTSLISADFNNDGHADIALANSDGTVSVMLGDGASSFHGLPDVAVGAGSLSSIAVGDFDRDGNLDLAVTQSAGKTMTVLLGKGTGSFASPVSYVVGNKPVSTLVTDLDKDGIPDLVVVNQGSNTYSVLGGNGDGTFRTSLDYVVGNGPLAAVAGEFNAEGHIDLAVVTPTSQAISVPLGNGDGTFKAARSYRAGFEPRAVASADINGDKRPDMVVTNYCGSDSSCSKGGTVSVFLANSDGTYKLSNTYLLGAGPVSVALTDVNGDKVPDIVALNRGDKTLSVLLAKGDGSFDQASTFSLTDSPIAVAVGDFNQDGKIDLAVLGDCGSAKCSAPGSVEVMLGQGSGVFASSFLYPTGYSPSSLAVGDLNHDKNLDIVVANRCGVDSSCQSAGTATVLLGSAIAKFKAAKDISIGNSPSSIALSDLSSSGSPDLLVTSSTDNAVTVLHSNGNGSFQAPTHYAVGNAPGALIVADFNGDGVPDVATANAQDSTVSVLFGKGDGTLNSSFALPVGTGPAALATVAGGSRSGLATANANSGSGPAGTDVTVLANVRPNISPDVLVTPTISAALTTGATPAVYGTSLVFTATVTGPAATTQPTGSVTFNDASVSGSPSLICTGTNDLVLTQNAMTDSTATCTIASLAGGTHSITATYVPGTDPTYGAAGPSTPALSQAITAATPTIATALTTGTASVAFGTTLTFTATVTGVTGLAIPTGSVTFFDGTTPLTCSNSVTLTSGSANSTATCTISSLSIGAHNINSSYAPGTDTNYLAAGPSNSVAETITKAGPTIAVALTTGTASATYGTALTFTATVTGLSGLAAPTGSVTFSDGATALTCSNSGTLTTGTTNSTATCNISSLAGGSHSINATYVPGTDPNYSAAGPSSSVTQTITKATPTVTLASGPNPSQFGSAVTLTATITGLTGLALPTGGTVTFNDGANAIACTNTVTLTQGTSNSTATCTYSSLPPGPRSITATYNTGSDPNYANATSTALAQNVNQLTPTVTVTSSKTPASNVNDNLTFNATVAANTIPAPSIGPTGTVSFLLNNAAITACTGLTLSGGSVSCPNITNLVATSDLITANYSGDTNYKSSTGNITQSVNALAATLGLAASAGPYSVGASVTFTATIKNIPLTPIKPAGTVSITVNGTAPTGCSGLNISTGTASCQTQFSIAQPYVIQAVYAGTDTNFIISPSTALPLQVGKATAGQISLVSSANPSSVNQLVTYTLSIAPPSGATNPIAPSGTATFNQGSTILCSAVPVAASGASCSYTFLAPSTGEPVTAAYSGDTNYSAGSSNTISQVVNASTTTTTLSGLPPSPTVVNQAVVFTATVKPGFSGTDLPAGTVTFNDASGGNSNALCSNVALVSGSASCNFTFTSAASNSVTATFNSSNGNFSNSTSAPVVQTVGASSTSVSISSSVPAGSSVNQSVTFSSAITAASIGSALPQGTVTYTDTLTSAVLCKVNVSTTDGSVPSCPATLLTAGTHSVVASFAPSNTNFQAASSSPFNQVVNAGTTTLALSSSANPSIVDQSVTFTANLTPAPAGATNPTGKVTFSYLQNGSSVVLCSVPQTVKTVSGSTSATCSAPLTGASAYTVTATYVSGDTNFTGSTSTPVTQTVNATGTSVSVSTPSPSPAFVDQMVSFSAVVAPAAGINDSGLTLPTGSVVFSDSIAGVLCTSTLAADGTVPVCKATLTTAGTHNITAVYSGDGNFTTSTSANAFGLTVNKASTTISVVSSSPASVVTQAVTYTATVTPALAGTAPTGTINFTLTQNGNSFACPANGSLTAGGTSPYTESCTISYPNTVSGDITVTATYTGDSNFTGSTSPSIIQSVQNFSSSIKPSVITLTQGSISTPNSNLTDPFSAIPIALSSTALNGFSDPITVTSCSVEADGSGNAIPGLTCTTQPSPTPATGVAVVTATSDTPIGTYTVLLTVADAKVPTLVHLVNLTVNIINLASQASTPIIGTAQATFNLAAPLPSGATLSFGNVSIVNTDGTYTTIPVTEVGIQFSAITAVSPTQYNFTVTAGSTATARLESSHNLVIAGAVGMPLLLGLSLLPGVRRGKKAWLRYFGMTNLAVAAMHSIGCSSGGFTRSSATVGEVGSYVIQINSTQNGTTTTVAVVPLLIEQ